MATERAPAKQQPAGEFGFGQAAEGFKNGALLRRKRLPGRAVMEAV